MNRSVLKAHQRGRYGVSTVDAPGFKGPLVTRDENQRITAWLRARGLMGESPWRKRHRP